MGGFYIVGLGRDGCRCVTRMVRIRVGCHITSVLKVKVILDRLVWVVLNQK